VSVRRILVLLSALVLLAAACDRGGDDGKASRSPTTVAPSPSDTTSPDPDQTGSAAAAMKELCDYGPPPGSEPPPAEGPTPEVITQVESAVEDLRGLSFTEPVVADAVTQEELVDGLKESFDYSFPQGLLARKSEAWQTIGVIPPGTSIRDDLETFASGQVIGYYDTLSGELVFIGTDDPSPMEKVTLAHELTHAIDDQNFGLERIDQLGTSCRDEAAAAAVALVEGNATFLMTEYALEDLTPQEQLEFAAEILTEDTSTPDVAPFISDQQLWSYTAGQSFVQALDARNGPEAIDQAFRSFPVSTEQILHPDAYPSDVPTPVDIPDLGPALGQGWDDLDVQEVGEAWLSMALALRMDSSDAADAAAGWDGGIYRAWSNGDQVAVELSTVWDTPADATGFADTMATWIAASRESQSAEVLPVQGNAVRVLFASDASTLDALSAAAS
jgi:hypothetical protein